MTIFMNRYDEIFLCRESVLIRKQIKFSIILLAIFLLSNADPLFAQRGQPSEAQLNALSKELGVPAASLEILNQSTLHLKFIDQRVTTLNVHNRETHEVYRITLDASDKEVDLNTLLEQDRAAKKARFGNLDPALHAILETKRGSDLVEVGIWLVVASEFVPRPTPEEYAAKGADVIRKEMEVLDREREARLSDLEKPLIEMIKTMGGEILQANTMAPIISARLTKDQVLSLSTLPEIDTIYHSNNQGSILGR